MKTKSPLLSPLRRGRSTLALTLIELVLVVAIVAVLIGMLFPHLLGSRVQIRDGQTKALAQAKQIGLAMKLYALDHNGAYPDSFPEFGETSRTSNDVFCKLFPAYTQSEKIFGNKLSAYQTAPPDDRYDAVYNGHPVETLKAGENVYACIAGVTERMPDKTPLIADGTNGDGLGHYVSDPAARGGTWSGARAVVIHLDTSGALENLFGPANARTLLRHTFDGTKAFNPLDPAILGPGVRLLDPAVAPAGNRQTRFSAKKDAAVTIR